VATRGFLIRFIDIGLIVLFGFLMISDIDALSRVDLASEAVAMEVEVPLNPEVRAFIVVEIGADGVYRITDSNAADAESVMARSANALSTALTAVRADHVESGLETVVLIQPHEASLVQATVDVMDVCDRLSLPKSLQMDIEIESVSPSGQSGTP
jgi:hypothetical protein